MISALRRGVAYCSDGAGNDRVDSHFSELGARPSRIAVHPVGGRELRTGMETFAADETGVDSERERCIGKAGMGADLAVAVAALLQRRHEGGLRGRVVVDDGVRARFGRLPLAIEAGGRSPHFFLVAGV